MTTVSVSVRLQVESCDSCGGVFGMSKEWMASRLENKDRGWNCPYCKTRWHYTGKTEAQKLAAQLDVERTRTANARAATAKANEATEAQRRKTIAQKAAKTRIKNRIAKGVCPCCNRQFTNLHRHMQNKHPDYTETDSTT